MSSKENQTKKELTEDEIKQRLEAARNKFDRNYDEFIKKPKLHFPCFRSTFLTSKLLRS